LSNNVIEHIKKNEDIYLEELKKFVRIPSISSDPERADKMIECANWVRDDLEKIWVWKVLK